MHHSSSVPADSSLSPSMTGIKTTDRFPHAGPPPNFYLGDKHVFRSIHPMAKDFLGGKAVGRRMKRMVPNEHKDDRYWEKRKRNNDAARRSRENKRQVEMGMRARTLFLEEELAVLRKEVAVLKTKFSLNPQCMYLSIDRNGELVPTSASSAFSSIEEAITNELQARVEGEYTQSDSLHGALGTSGSADIEGSSSDDYIPMKKRRRPKLEAQLSHSAGTNASSVSPSESVGTPYYPPPVAQQQVPSKEPVNHSVEMNNNKTQSKANTIALSSDYNSSSTASSLYSTREHHLGGELVPTSASSAFSSIEPHSAPPRVPHNSEMNSLPDVYSYPMNAYHTNGKLPGVNFIKMQSSIKEVAAPENHPTDYPTSLSPSSASQSPSSINYPQPPTKETAESRENNGIRNQLLHLSAEVATMKNFILHRKVDE